MKILKRMGLVLNLFLLSVTILSAQETPVVNVKKAGTKFEHFWSKCVGAGRANEGLRASWLEHLKIVKANCGFQYCRFHGLFHDDMFVYREVNQRGDYNGQPVYNFQYIDDLFDRMLDIGVKPFVELGFFPKDIAAPNSKTLMWWKANVTPPDDLAKWEALITRFIQHCLERYGAEEVRTWYFEVWNEPNLRAFFDADQKRYFEIYSVTAKAIKAIDNKLRVGGPATSSFRRVKDQNGNTRFVGAWIEDFLAFCTKENLPVDFISTHPYPHEWAFDAEQENLKAENIRLMTSTHDDMLWLKNTIAKSAYPHAEIHLTEWSSSASSRDHSHDRLPAASYLLKVNLQCIGLANSLSYWTFTDVFEEKGIGNSIFHGGFGMINYQGLLKPSFHAYRMLNSLGDEMLYRDQAIFVSRHSKSGKITAVITHYPAEMQNKGIPVSNFENEASAERACELGKPEKYSLTLTGLKANTYFEVEIMDRNHANVYEDWRNMGSPEPPTRQQIKLLKEKSTSTLKEIIKTDEQGNLKWSKVLTPWSCVLLSQI